MRAARMRCERNAAVVTAEDAMAMLEPGDILIDYHGPQLAAPGSLDAGAPSSQDDGANTLKIRLEYALVITFLYGQTYDCNEYCKYYKNIENAHYKFIPMVQRTHSDGGVSHVTGIVNITAEEYEAMPPRFDGEWLRSQLSRRRRSRRTVSSTRSSRRPRARYSATSMSSGYRSISTGLATRRAGSGERRGPATTPSPARRSSWRATAAIGSPYFQSISLGFECAMYLAGLMAQRDLPRRGHARAL